MRGCRARGRGRVGCGRGGRRATAPGTGGGCGAARRSSAARPASRCMRARAASKPAASPPRAGLRSRWCRRCMDAAASCCRRGSAADNGMQQDVRGAQLWGIAACTRSAAGLLHGVLGRPPTREVAQPSLESEPSAQQLLSERGYSEGQEPPWKTAQLSLLASWVPPAWAPLCRSARGPPSSPPPAAHGSGSNVIVKRESLTWPLETEASPDPQPEPGSAGWPSRGLAAQPPAGMGRTVALAGLADREHA